MINAEVDDKLVKEFCHVIYEARLEEAMLDYIQRYSQGEAPESRKEAIAPETVQ